MAASKERKSKRLKSLRKNYFFMTERLKTADDNRTNPYARSGPQTSGHVHGQQRGLLRNPCYLLMPPAHTRHGLFRTRRPKKNNRSRRYVVPRSKISRRDGQRYRQRAPAS